MCQTNQTLEALNAEKIRMAIENQNQLALAGIDIFDSINSTNTYLLECAKKGMPSGSVCLAEQQSAGRGRQGRTWFSPRSGNIYCSLLWHFSVDHKDLAALSIAVAVMTAQALKKYGISDGLQLKWPNDILFEGKKLAGILLERVAVSEQAVAVVIGIGLNIQLPKENNLQNEWMDVASIVGKVDRNFLLGLLINELLEKLKVFQRDGLPPFLTEWQALDAYDQKNIIVQQGEEKMVGQMVGINSSGELLLQKEDGELKTFRCGEVSVRSG